VVEVLTFAEFLRKTHIPLLDKPPEEQDWDVSLLGPSDWSGHTASSHLVWATEQGDWRWNEYDPVYEEMWKDMARTVDPEAQEEKVRQMAKYFYDRAIFAFIYSPLTLYAANKEVNFVPQEFGMLRLKETSVTDSHWSLRAEVEPE